MVESDAAIVSRGLTKRYEGAGFDALKQLNLSVKRGEIYGFLGPNGAGKTTAIRTLLNFIQPTKGSAQILGKDIVKDSVEIKKFVGYLAGEIALYPKMTGREFLEYMTQLQLPKNKSYIDELVRQFQVDLKPEIRELSKGNRQKVALLQAFMHEPQVLILDEPTGGLDPLMQEQFFKLVKEHKQRGATLFISSHNLSEVQKMCDRVGFIRSGELINEQNIAEAINAAARTFDINFIDEAPFAALKKLKGAKVTGLSRNLVTIHMRGDLSPLFKELAKHRVASINQRELNLEEEFLHFYEAKP
jgi:ABC-2 type transport system ATP-binding protein